MSEAWIETAASYRIMPVGNQHQPEMLYQCKDGPLWVPLNAAGFWADPAAYSTGEVTKQSLMSEEDAARAVWRARIVNKVHRA